MTYNKREVKFTLLKEDETWKEFDELKEFFEFKRGAKVFKKAIHELYKKVL